MDDRAAGPQRFTLTYGREESLESARRISHKPKPSTTIRRILESDGSVLR